MSMGRPPGLTDESKKLRVRIVRLRDVEKKTFRQIAEIVHIEHPQVHRLYHTNVVAR